MVISDSLDLAVKSGTVTSTGTLVGDAPGTAMGVVATAGAIAVRRELVVTVATASVGTVNTIGTHVVKSFLFTFRRLATPLALP